MLDSEEPSFFHIISFSMFSDVKGPVPVYCYPDSVSETIQVEIAMKSVSLLMGEAVYQAGMSDDLRYFGILPFPDLNYIGLTYFFLIPDENARGKSKAATVTIIVKDSNHHFIYDNIHTLRILLDKTRANLRTQHEHIEIQNILNILRVDILHLYKNTSKSTVHSLKKIVFAGLNNSGKSSFLKEIQRVNSKTMELIPTMETKQLEQEILPGITTLEWNFGVQKNYREEYFKNATIYLNDVDLLFYFIDIQDLDRLDESLQYLSEILHTLENFGNFPFIQIALHKSDPIFIEKDNLEKKISQVKSLLLNLHPKWDLKIFPTSLFDPPSIHEFLLYGFSHLNPKIDKLEQQLIKLVQRVHGHTAVILANNALVLGEYSSTPQWHKIIDDIREDMYEIINMERNFQEQSNIYRTLKMDGTIVIIYRLTIDFREFFILFDTAVPIPKMEKSIKKMKKQIIPIIQSYLN